MSRQPSPQSSSSISTDPNKTGPNRVVEFDEAEFARCLAGEWSNGERLSIAHSVKEYLTDRVAQGAAASGQSLLPEPRSDTARAEVADTVRADTPQSGSTSDTSPEVIWSRLQAELRDFAEQESTMWGGVDECLLARYLAGECTDDELQKVDQAAVDHPAVRECLELVQEVMADEEIDSLPIVDLNVSWVRHANAKTDLPPFLATKAEASIVAPAATLTAAPRRSFASWVAAAALLMALGSTWLHFAEKPTSDKSVVRIDSDEPGAPKLDQRLSALESTLVAMKREQATNQEMPAMKSAPQPPVTMAQAKPDGILFQMSAQETTKPPPSNQPNSAVTSIHVAESVRGQRITGEIAGCAPGYSSLGVVTVFKPEEPQIGDVPKPAFTAANRMNAVRLEQAALAESDGLPLLPLSELVNAARDWQAKDLPLRPVVAKALRKELGDPSDWPKELIDAILKQQKDPTKTAAFVLTGEIDLKNAAELSAVVDHFKNSDKPELRAAAMALAGEIDSQGTIEFSAVIDGLKSQNRLERWAAVSALSATWQSSCGAFLVTPQEAPQGTASNGPHEWSPKPQAGEPLHPVPDQRFTRANVVTKATPTLTVFKPVFESVSSVPTQSSPAREQNFLADGQRDDEPIRQSSPPTFSQPASSAPTYEAPTSPVPVQTPPTGAVRQHPLAANADELVPQLVTLLDLKEDPLVRRTALHVIADFGSAALPARESLERILKNDAEAVSRRWAAYAIGRIGSEARESFGILVGCLIAEKDASVLTAVCFAISELARGEKPLLDIERNLASTQLSSLLADHADPQVRRWAAFAFNSVNRPQQAQGEIAPQNYTPATTALHLEHESVVLKSSEPRTTSKSDSGSQPLRRKEPVVSGSHQRNDRLSM